MDFLLSDQYFYYFEDKFFGGQREDAVRRFWAGLVYTMSILGHFRGKEDYWF